MLFSREKMRVDIKRGQFITRSKMCRVEGNRVIIDKGTKGRGHVGWSAEFDESCRLYYKSGLPLFRTLKPKVIVTQDADHCIAFTQDDNAEVPIFDRAASNRHIQANVIKSAGDTKTKVELPFMFYLIMGGVIILNVASFLISTGRLRI